MTDAPIEIALDQTDCCGSGMCAAIAPTAFRLDRSGVGVVTPEATGTDRTLLLQAARACPTCCITLSENGAEIDLF
jgi:ferredoxin